MGTTHLDVYRQLAGKAAVVAIAEPDAKKRAGDFSGAGGNIGNRTDAPSLSGIELYESLEALLANADVDVVDITLPTFMHRDAVLGALAAGKHAICEKPLALDYDAAREMADAAKQAGRSLYVGQCIRFWPAYVAARELLLGGTLGKARTAAFSRVSPLPGWMWRGWARDQQKSGGAPLDLHIHDADYISHLFGRPSAVSAFVGGRRGSSGRIDHIAACYHYPDDLLVTAVGAWEYAAGYPFSMTFSIHADGGTLALAADGTLALYRDGAEPETIPVAPGDGWMHELGHFVDCIAAGEPSAVISAEEAVFAVKLVMAAVESARIGRRVEIPETP
jgi:predicted dehydrogenase